MSFKREGDDWSQLNVLKVSARGERREQLPLPSEGREGVVLLLWQQMGDGGCELGVGGRGVRVTSLGLLVLGCDPFFAL